MIFFKSLLHLYIRIIFSALITLILSSCSKNSDTSTEPDNGYYIYGRIVNEDSTDVSGITINVIGNEITKTATTDSNGLFAISGLLEGIYILSPSKEGYKFNPIEVSVGITNSSQIVEDIIAMQVNSISGSILTNDGKGIPDIPLLLYYNETQALEAMTDTTGNYSFIDITDGSYTLTIFYNSYNESVTVNGKDIIIETINLFHPENVQATYNAAVDSINVEWEMDYPQSILDIIKGYYIVVSDLSDFDMGHVFHRYTDATDNSYSLDAGFIPADVDSAIIYIKVSAVYENEKLHHVIGPRSEPAVAVEIKR